MGRLVKEKNIIEYWADGKTTPYKLDINTGTMYGLRGSAIKSAPPKFADTLYQCQRENIVYKTMYFLYRHYGINAICERHTVLQVYDRLASLGYTANNYTDNNRAIEIADALNGSARLFKRVAEMVKNNPNCEIWETISNYAEDMWLEDNHIHIDEHFTEEMAHFLYTLRKFSFMPKYVNLVKYWVNKGLLEYDGQYSAKDKLRIFFEYCEYCNVEPQKSDFFRQYIEVKRSAIRLKEQKDNAIMAEKQNAQLKALSFEDENFIVVIPQTIKELTDEGNKQHNCVGGYGSQIARGEKCVVFIRKKSIPDVPYITCDIYAKNDGYYRTYCGYINQYLIHHNNGVTDPLALDFKVKYQEHLLANWGK